MKRYAELRRQHPIASSASCGASKNVCGWGFGGCVQRISRHEIVYVTATLTTVEIPDVLVDTGAASTVINADLAADAGIYLEATDKLRRLRGVGGHEHVFLRRVDRFEVGDHGLDGFDVGIGDGLRLRARRDHRNGLPTSSARDHLR